MLYYHINPNTLTIIAGPFHEQDGYVKQLTSCGNPECLNLASYNLVPLVTTEINSDDDDLGAPIVTLTAVTQTTAQLTLAEVRRRKRARVEEICNNKLDRNVAFEGNNYSTAPDQRALIFELLMYAERNPTLNTVVRRLNGIPVELTLAQMQALAVAISDRTAACLARSKVLYDLIGTSTRQELRAIDLQAGWPD